MGRSGAFGKVWGVVDVEEDIIDTDWNASQQQVPRVTRSMRHTLHVAWVAVTALVSHV
jgi:hypothetical protein